ncbi:MAG TPA: long-chain fatty acid--CoA ligase [Longimicrobiales bacterium]|nr:long-chain fatty acid--CoA ligase [Longimicrobiales bacterium]
MSAPPPETIVRDGTYAATPYDVPEGTVAQLFLEGCAEWPEREAFRFKENGAWRGISRADLLERVRDLAAGLDALGQRPGDKLAILSENRLDWALADYATVCRRGVSVPVYATLPANQIHYLLENSGVRFAFVSDAEQLAKVMSLRERLPALERVVVFDDDAVADEGDDFLITMRDVVRRGADERSNGDAGADFEELALSSGPADLLTILYTSGTTGRPKGVMLTHGNLFYDVEASLIALPLHRSRSALSLLPLSHIFERMLDYALFRAGVTIAYAESIDAVPANLLQIRPHIVASVPRLYEKIHARVMAASGARGKLVDWAVGVGERWADDTLAGRTPPLPVRLQHAVADGLVFSKLRERTGGELEFFVSGGAPLSEDIARFFYAAGVLILEGYGLTETSPVTNVNTPDNLRLGTVGKPIPGTEIRIAEDGEILVRGPQVMKGYYDLPEATEAALRDGWFHTGDVGEIDAEGFLKITDRKKELLVTAGGKNIAPAPIEQSVKANRFVQEAVMVGDRMPYTVLLVVPDYDALEAWAAASGIRAATHRELIEDPAVQSKIRDEVFGCFDKLARYETPKKVGLLERPFSIEAGELTPTLKVKRRVVVERYGATMEALYDTEADVIAEVRPPKVKETFGAD